MRYLIIILLLASFVCADICTITGYVTHEDSTKATRGTVVTITDSYYNTTYVTKTGGRDWPLQNFYVQTLTCIFNTSMIIESNGISREIVFDKYPYEVNLTIPSVPFVEQPLHNAIVEDKQVNDMTIIISYLVAIASFMAIQLLYRKQ